MMYSQNRTQKDLGSTWIIALFRNRQCLHLFDEIWVQLTKNHLTKSSTEKFREHI